MIEHRLRVRLASRQGDPSLHARGSIRAAFAADRLHVDPLAAEEMARRAFRADAYGAVVIGDHRTVDHVLHVHAEGIVRRDGAVH